MGKVLALVSRRARGARRRSERRSRTTRGGTTTGRAPSNPLTLNVGDNVNSSWDAYLNDGDLGLGCVERARPDRSVRRERTGSTCSPTSGRIEVCNARLRQHGLARHRADLGAAQPHHAGDDEGERHVLRQLAVQHAAWRQTRHVPGGRARLRARPPGRELQQREPRDVHGLHERPRRSAVERAPERARLRAARVDLRAPGRLGGGGTAAATRTSRAARRTSATRRRSRRRAERTATSTSTNCRTADTASRTSSGRRSARNAPNARAGKPALSNDQCSAPASAGRFTRP